MRSVRLVRLSAGLGLALALTAGATTTALAHATLISSNPGNGAVLATPPDQVQLQFDVPVNPRLSGVELEDRSGRRLAGPEIEPGPAVGSLLTIDLPPLRRGVYRLDFEARDDTDLHETAGAIVFGVGEAADIQAPPAVAPGPSYLETGTRWLELAGTCLLVGLATVWLGILPALGRRRVLAVSARSRLLVVAALGFLAFVIGKAGQLLVADAGLGAGGALSWQSATWTALTAGRFGLLWLAAVVTAGVVLVAALTSLVHARSRPAGGVLVLATAALLVVSTATSHGANQDGPDPLLIAIRVVHLGAAGLWVGGLTVLVSLFAGAFRGGAPEAPAALLAFRRFTGLAFVAVGLLTVSGLLLVGRGVGSPAQLLTTTYGLTLVAKLIAGAAAIGFGVRHTFLLSPPRGGGVGGPVKLVRSVPFEVGAMLVVLWGAAALGATAPAPISGTPAAGVALPMDVISLVDDLTVHESMRPGRPGANTLLVQIVQTGSTAEPAVSRVEATLTQPGQRAETLAGRSVEHGSYQFSPARVAAPGGLAVAITITRPDGRLDRATSTWTVAPPAPQPPGLPATPWGPELDDLALALGLALAGFLGTRLVMRRLRQAPAH